MISPLQTLTDHNEIATLLARMTRLINDQDIETYLECFVEDGIFELIGMPPTVGRNEIRPLVSSTPGVVHMTMDVVVLVDGDHATADSNLLSAWSRLDRANNGFLYSGRYRDELTRTPAGWKMRHRRVSLDLDPARIFTLIQQEAGAIDRDEWIAAAAARWENSERQRQETS
jgi:3-phenylpropionate/cinnamic acid dioxygenase small subunit